MYWRGRAKQSIRVPLLPTWDVCKYLHYCPGVALKPHTFGLTTSPLRTNMDNATP